jgi:DNA polymerase III epsilon subunit-like protein
LHFTKKREKEGKTYETGIGLNLGKETSTTTRAGSNTMDIDVNRIIMSMTKNQCKELIESVPTYIERPVKQTMTYDANKMYQIVIFDTETTCTGKNAEICQLSAIRQSGETFSQYILPQCSVGYYASRVNNLTVEVINGSRTLCKNFQPMCSVTLDVGLQSFINFLQEQNTHTCGRKDEQPITVLIGHNAATFDVPTLLRNAGHSFKQQLCSMNMYFGDSLSLIRSLLSQQHEPLKQSNGEFCQANLASVYKCLFNKDFNAHDALEDVIALRKILFSPEMAIDLQTLLDGSQMSSVRSVMADLNYIDRRHERYQTFLGNLHCPNDVDSPISNAMALKIAGSGLTYDDLLQLWNSFGETGVVAVLHMPPYQQNDPCNASSKSHPRVTKNKRIISSIVKFFQSISI